MTAPAMKQKRPASHRLQGHIHLPSVHVRKDGAGFDYDEDIYLQGNRAKRIVRFVAIEGDQPFLIRQTYDVLCREELAQLRENLLILMDEGNPAAMAIMKECARKEFDRQQAIAAGQETACRGCGCSDSRACSGGCVWATPVLCSRCL